MARDAALVPVAAMGPVREAEEAVADDAERWLRISSDG